MSRFDVATCSAMLASFAIMLLSLGVAPPARAQDTCSPAIARIVSVQGSVQVQRAGQPQWVPARLDTPLCAGDRVQTGVRSRAALVISPETLVRLDQNSALSIQATQNETIVEFFQDSTAPREALGTACGAGYFITRFPRSFKVRTPFLNAAVEGTEFLVALSCQATTLSVFEGQVAADVPNAADQRLALHSGETTSAGPGLPPAVQVLVKPIDAVQWALYYPSLGGAVTALTANQACDQSEAAALAACLTQRARQRLRVGRADEAQVDLQQALDARPADAEALALLAIIDVVKNDKSRALERAKRAVQTAPGSASAWVALSFAEQADFQLQQALESIQRAVSIEPNNAALRARAAELLLSVGRVDAARAEAQEAVRLDPGEARAHVALGFVNLAQIRSGIARGDFERAIALDPSNPTPRLGLGLALIRAGQLVEGRQQIEIAVGLDPVNSVLRSYVGKAYYEENTKARDKLATSQYNMAESLDPKDPTPWFYDAFLKQSQNRPVEALQDLDESIRLNDNRAVYRSRLLLDEDLAARSASQARIYSDLNFEQLAFVEGWRSLAADPTNYSAHRFLADAYLGHPRTEVSRLSELLQSQLWQPLNLQPLQPQLAEPGLFIPPGTGPTRLSYNEYNSLFTSNGLRLLADGIAGDNSTWGDDVVVSGLAGRVSFSLGQSHFQTDGWRTNSDQTRELGNAFVQVALSADTSVQAEYRTQRNDFGDLQLRFDPTMLNPNERTDLEVDTARLGFRHDFAPSVRVIGSFLAQKATEDKTNSFSRVQVFPPSFPGFPPTVANQEFRADQQPRAEVVSGRVANGQRVEPDAPGQRPRVLRRFERGIASRSVNHDFAATVPISPTDSSPPAGRPNRGRAQPSRQSLLLWQRLPGHRHVNWTLGLSVNDYNRLRDRDQVQSQVRGVWTPTPSTTVRAAAFRCCSAIWSPTRRSSPLRSRGSTSSSTISPRPSRHAMASASINGSGAGFYAGLEASKRQLDIPFGIDSNGQTVSVETEQTFNRAYLYWTPTRQLALRAEYQFDLRNQPAGLVTDGFNYLRLSTQRAPLGASWFMPIGLTLSGTATWVKQDGKFSDTLSVPSVESTGEASFWLVDAQVSYRLPNRHGAIAIGVSNLLDQQVHYFDPDPNNPWLYPERFAYVRLQLQF